jgi:N6-L-threonylcarbamoyladenine synthase
LITKGNEKGIKILFPSLELCTDNAAMIGSAAYYQWELGNVSTMDLNAKPNLKLGEK